MSKTIYRDECHLFGILRKSLFRDLIANGWPPSVAGSILNWFDPSSEDYLTHVSGWQEALCVGDASALPASVVAYMRTPVLHDWSCWAVRDLHFIAKLFYKFRGQVRDTPGKALESAKTRLARPGRPSLSTSEVRRLSNALKALRPFDIEKGYGSYGPGTTSDGLDKFARWCRDGSFPERVPITAYISSLDDYACLGKIAYKRYGITKIAEVPKTIKSNRVVSSEPANWMFVQKMVGDALSAQLHRIFRGNVYLHSAQKHNELLWHYGFRSIDLSDASDHITRTLVHQIFPREWVDLLFKVRSTFAQFPDGTIVPLRTFAPMGSGICFPVLTAVCLAVCKCTCQHTYHVYGDDIIVHTDDFDRVFELLEHCGLVINRSKCALGTTFRESCGLDIFDNLDISPCYIREDWLRSFASKIELISQKCEEFGFLATRDTILDEMASSGCYPIRRYRWDQDSQDMHVEVQTRRRLPQVQLPANHGLFRWWCLRAQNHRVAQRERDDEPLVWAFRPADDYRTLFRRLLLREIQEEQRRR